MRKRLFVITGMHRSGTSLLARGAVAIGIPFGSELLGPTADNAKGYWEDRRINDLADQVLQSCGSRWSALAPVSEAAFQRPEIVALAKKAAGLLADKCGEQTHWGFKNPRVCVQMPFWDQVFGQLSAGITYIVAVRHPMEVAGSLEKRDQMPLSVGLRLWFSYNLQLLARLSGRPAVFVAYDALLQQPQAQLRRIAMACDLAVDARIADEIEGYGNSFVSDALRHNRVAQTEAMPGEVGDLFGLLRQLCSQAGLADLRDQKTALARQARELRGRADWLALVDETFTRFVMRENQPVLPPKRRQEAQLTGAIATLQNELVVRDAQAQELKDELARCQMQWQQAVAQIEATRQQETAWQEQCAAAQQQALEWREQVEAALRREAALQEEIGAAEGRTEAWRDEASRLSALNQAQSLDLLEARQQIQAKTNQNAELQHSQTEKQNHIAYLEESIVLRDIQAQQFKDMLAQRDQQLAEAVDRSTALELAGQEAARQIAASAEDLTQLRLRHEKLVELHASLDAESFGLRRHIHQIEAGLAQRDAEAERQQDRLAAMLLTLESAEAAWQQASDGWEAAKRSIAEREAAIATLHDELAARDAARENLEAAHHAANQVAALILAQRDQDIQAAMGRIAVLTPLLEEVATLQQTLTGLQQEIDQQRHALSLGESRIAELEQRWRRLGIAATVARDESGFDSRRQRHRIMRLEAILAQQMRERAALHRWLLNAITGAQTILASRRWRLGDAVVRGLGALLKHPQDCSAERLLRDTRFAYEAWRRDGDAAVAPVDWTAHLEDRLAYLPYRSAPVIMPRATVFIILEFDDDKLWPPLVQLLRNTPRHIADVVLVDNSGGDAAVAALRLALSQGAGSWRDLVLPAKCSYADIANRAFQETDGDIVLVQAGVEVGRYWLTDLRLAAAAGADVALVSPFCDTGGNLAVAPTEPILARHSIEAIEPWLRRYAGDAVPVLHGGFSGLLYLRRAGLNKTAAAGGNVFERIDNDAIRLHEAVCDAALHVLAPRLWIRRMAICNTENARIAEPTRSVEPTLATAMRGLEAALDLAAQATQVPRPRVLLLTRTRNPDRFTALLGMAEFLLPDWEVFVVHWVDGKVQIGVGPLRRWSPGDGMPLATKADDLALMAVLQSIIEHSDPALLHLAENFADDAGLRGLAADLDLPVVAAWADETQILAEGFAAACAKVYRDALSARHQATPLRILVSDDADASFGRLTVLLRQDCIAGLVLPHTLSISDWFNMPAEEQRQHPLLLSGLDFSPQQIEALEAALQSAQAAYAVDLPAGTVLPPGDDEGAAAVLQQRILQQAQAVTVADPALYQALVRLDLLRVRLVEDGVDEVSWLSSSMQPMQVAPQAPRAKRLLYIGGRQDAFALPLLAQMVDLLPGDFQAELWHLQHLSDHAMPFWESTRLRRLWPMMAEAGGDVVTPQQPQDFDLVLAPWPEGPEAEARAWLMLAPGLPAICSELASAPDLPNEAAVVRVKNDAAAWAMAIAGLQHDEGRYAGLVAAARRHLMHGVSVRQRAAQLFSAWYMLGRPH